ncbi:MAG: hypothetical protein AAB623_01375 [Patescibacteria group bacterium]
MNETMNMGLSPEEKKREKYKFDDDYIYLPLTIENLPPKLNVSGYELSAKEEFHCSLVCIRDLKEKYGDDVKEKILNLFYDFVSKNDTTFIKYRNEFRLVQRWERVSVIVMCDISNIDKFFKLMNQELGIESDTQPTHVTIYTLQPNMGIGVNTFLGFQATKEIEVLNEVRVGLNLG